MEYANNFEELGHFVWNIWGVLLGSIVSHFQTRVYSNIEHKIKIQVIME